MRILVTRPESDATREAERLVAFGHEPVLAPLLAITFIPDAPLDLDNVQALVATSRNALRALAQHPQREEALGLPLIAVGRATAKAAAELGFSRITTGPGSAAALVDTIAAELSPEAGALLHLSGDTLAFDLATALEARGFRVRRSVLYRAEPAAALPPDIVAMIKEGRLDGVILMSPRTAATFASLVRHHGLVTPAERLVCYCLSGAVAQAVRQLGARLRVAAKPREEDVLALISSDAASSGHGPRA